MAREDERGRKRTNDEASSEVGTRRKLVRHGLEEEEEKKCQRRVRRPKSETCVETYLDESETEGRSGDVTDPHRSKASHPHLHQQHQTRLRSSEVEDPRRHDHVHPSLAEGGSDGETSDEEHDRWREHLREDEPGKPQERATAVSRPSRSEEKEERERGEGEDRLGSFRSSKTSIETIGRSNDSKNDDEEGNHEGGDEDGHGLGEKGRKKEDATKGKDGQFESPSSPPPTTQPTRNQLTSVAHKIVQKINIAQQFLSSTPSNVGIAPETNSTNSPNARIQMNPDFESHLGKWIVPRGVLRKG